MVAGLMIVAAACGGSTGNREEARLVDAHAGLCLAATKPSAARAIFFDRAHDALHEVARRLDNVDRAQAARLLEAKERVESGLNTTREHLSEDMLALADVYRQSLARLAVTVPPCDK